MFGTKHLPKNTPPAQNTTNTTKDPQPPTNHHQKIFGFWQGDSHTNGDPLTNRLRAALNPWHVHDDSTRRLPTWSAPRHHGVRHRCCPGTHGNLWRRAVHGDDRTSWRWVNVQFVLDPVERHNAADVDGAVHRELGATGAGHGNEPNWQEELTKTGWSCKRVPVNLNYLMSGGSAYSASSGASAHKSEQPNMIYTLVCIPTKRVVQ